MKQIALVLVAASAFMVMAPSSEAAPKSAKVTTKNCGELKAKEGEDLAGEAGFERAEMKCVLAAVPKCRPSRVIMNANDQVVLEYRLTSEKGGCYWSMIPTKGVPAEDLGKELKCKVPQDAPKFKAWAISKDPAKFKGCTGALAAKVDAAQ